MPVGYELDGHVATITIDRPDALNAIDLETWDAFSGATSRLEDDAQAWVGIVVGAGDRAFCAGADLRSTIPRLLDDPDNNPYPGPPTIMRGQTVTKPLIAAVGGLALGGGLEIVLACDLRVAAENARLGAPEVTLGLIPGWGATQRLPRQIPWAVAARIVFTGQLPSNRSGLALLRRHHVIDQTRIHQVDVGRRGCFRNRRMRDCGGSRNRGPRSRRRRRLLGRDCGEVHPPVGAGHCGDAG